jgi:hypothetical protein
MDLLSGIAIFLLGASAGSIIRYFQDRDLVRKYREEARRSLQALLEVMNAYESSSGRKVPVTSENAPAPVREESVRSA